MGGPIKSKCTISAVSIESVNGNLKDCFAGIADYFDNRGGFQRISSNYGGGTAFGYNSSQNKVGNEAWGVWRAVSASITYDIAVAVATSDFTSNWISSPTGTGNVGIILAWHSSSAAWNGTTNNNGSDTFSTPWKSGTRTGLAVNRTGSAANCLMSVYPGNLSLPTNNSLFLITGDYDTTIIYNLPGRDASPSSTTNTQFGAVLGVYNPITSSITVPLIQWDMKTSPNPVASTIGSLSTATEGGLIISNSRTLRFGFDHYYHELNSANSVNGTHINNTSTRNIILEYPVNIWTDEINGTFKDIGNVSMLNFASTYMAGNLRFFRDNSRLIVYMYNVGCFSIPWDSSSVNLATRESSGW
jgi:hypothetical protein